MARELEQYPDLNIPKTILYPVPNILRGVRKVTTYQTEAVNSVNMTAGRIIHLIDKDIRIQKSAGINEHSAKYIENLEATKELMKQYRRMKNSVCVYTALAKQCCASITFPVALTTMMVNQLVTMCRCVVCLSAMKLSVMESSSTVNSRKQNLAFMTL